MATETQTELPEKLTQEEIDHLAERRKIPLTIPIKRINDATTI